MYTYIHTYIYIHTHTHILYLVEGGEEEDKERAERGGEGRSNAAKGGKNGVEERREGGMRLLYSLMLISAQAHPTSSEHRQDEGLFRC